MATLAMRGLAWRVPVLWRAATGRGLFPAMIAAALVLAAASAERLVGTPPPPPFI